MFDDASVLDPRRAESIVRKPSLMNNPLASAALKIAERVKPRIVNLSDHPFIRRHSSTVLSTRPSASRQMLL